MSVCTVSGLLQTIDYQLEINLIFGNSSIYVESYAVVFSFNSNTSENGGEV